MEDFALLDLSDDEKDTKLSARQERIERARKQALDYRAKIEEEQWFLREEARCTGGNKDGHRKTIFTIQHYYLTREYRRALDLGLDSFHGESLEGNKKEGIDQVELLDLILKSWFKLRDREEESVPVTAEMLAVARKWATHRSNANLSFTSSRLLLESPRSLLESPTEPLIAILNSIKWHPTQQPYLIQLEKVLERLGYSSLAQASRARDGKDEVFSEELDRLGLEQEERTMLEKVLRGQVKEEEEGNLRDVRSL